MIKILSAKQIKELDSYTITNEPVSSVDLMERASRAFVNEFILYFDELKRVGIVCGTGNNGGDGLAVARLLNERGYRVAIWIVRGSVPETEDFKTNLKRIDGKLPITEISSDADRGLFTNIDVLIDGVFGSGLSRPVAGIYEQVIQCMNKSEAAKVAIDIPSGLLADGPSTGEIFKADLTISFQLPKLTFFLPQSFQYTGNWRIVDIGLKKEFISKAESSVFYISRKAARSIVKSRSKFDHKGTFGHALIIGGSYGKIGAAVLSTRAALRSGAGLVTTHIPKCGYSILQTSVPEAMVDVDAEDSYFTAAHDIGRFTAIGIGPGLGREQQTVLGLEETMKTFGRPMVIDADGLNILSEHKQLLKLVPPGSILTPHPKEFERLVGSWGDDFDKLSKLKKLSKDLQSTIILKGAYTVTADVEGNLYFNSTGNPAMATGGTGDVLTGILTSLLAQSYSCTEAAILGVYLHGSAGDLVATELGDRGLMASDLINMIPSAYKKLIRG